MPLQIEQFMCRSDNFGVLVHDPETGSTAAIDAPQEGPIRERLDEKGWQLTHILVTHHHGDHVEAIAPLKAAFGCEVTGPAEEAGKIDGLDRLVGGGDRFDWAGHPVEVIATPGHTAGHICYHFPQDKVVFTADTLFAMGCGRLFERGPEEMFASLSKLAALPPETVVYCGHEYTLANARFAVTVDPENPALAARLKEVEALRAENRPTLPTTIGRELETNPFLRWGDPAIRAHLGMTDAADWEVLAEVRKRKDKA
ncbi:MAG: hydroxyacylglutathione hydrolase [Zhengella sp.]|uniref:hydroxyacylglutathione hydrolase n=1 Tax=Zhengella sp. TaxID=2282762 RepID=UPI001D5ADD78|nr:hydroxyacylglutathione hydrolase [Notoacmeibacter sp.]MCC0028559.1 hydroxyacylglutathione hydrolase [Brucellaceae bacterium]